MFENIYKDRRVLVTGHTGFKGSWLCAWLIDLGAKVAGYSLDIPTKPSHFETLCLADRLEHFQGDIRSKSKLEQTLKKFRPEIVFHLAAQSLVRKSYQDPVLTFETNTLGTLNLMVGIHNQNSVTAGVFITSDKCYENEEWVWGYRENDRLGGKDPYSASKACAEIVSTAYMESFFKKNGPNVATSRAGNVIGGGDWAVDRIIPDCVRAWSKNQSATIRNPQATRPWQHVLEPVSGYLVLGQKLFQGDSRARNQSFNFGPCEKVNQPVADLISEMARFWPRAKWGNQQETNSEKPESTLLKLNCDKALETLRWRSVLDFQQTVELTARWYQTFYNKDAKTIPATTSRQIQDYIAVAVQSNLPWTN